MGVSPKSVTNDPDGPQHGAGSLSNPLTYSIRAAGSFVPYLPTFLSRSPNTTHGTAVDADQLEWCQGGLWGGSPMAVPDGSCLRSSKWSWTQGAWDGDFGDRGEKGSDDRRQP